MKMSRATRAYLECALWSSVCLNGDDEWNGNLDDHYDVENLPETFVAAAEQEVSDFLAEHRSDLDLLGIDDKRAAHCVWLTREHHGAGFGDYCGGGSAQDAAARRLKQAAQALGEGYSDLIAALPPCQCCQKES